MKKSCLSKRTVVYVIYGLLQAGSDWLLIYPEGIRDLLLHAKLKFNDPALYVTENGKSITSRKSTFKITDFYN